jgi:hypothetical protein
MKLKKKRIGVNWAIAMLLAVLPVRMTGQQSAAPVARTIEGMVVDRAGSPVPGAVVLIEDLKSLQVRSYLVQQDGKYHFHGLSSDANYELRAQCKGEVSGPKTVTVFRSGDTVEVNLKLTGKSKRSAPANGAAKDAP